MENNFQPGSNTLANAARLSEGYALDFTLMVIPGAEGTPAKVSLKMTPTPVRDGKRLATLPIIDGVTELETLDQEFNDLLYKMLHEGVAAQAVDRFVGYAEKVNKETDKLENAAASAASKMPPPARTPQTPAAPKTPAPPKKGSTEVVESKGTGANAPATPAAPQAPAAPTAPSAPTAPAAPNNGVVDMTQSQVEEPAASVIDEELDLSAPTIPLAAPAAAPAIDPLLGF